jgi:hypothetical protein
LAQRRLNAVLRAGIRAAQQNNNERARDLLEQVLRRKRNSEIAWIWMTAVVNSNKEKRVCLKNILRINPKNQAARDAMTRLGSVLDNVDRSIDPRLLMRYAQEELPDVPEDERPVRASGGSGLPFNLTRQQLQTALIGVAAVLVVLIGVLLLAGGGGTTPEPTPTQVVAVPDVTAELTAELTVELTGEADVPVAPTVEPGLVVTRPPMLLPTNTPTITPTPTITLTPTATLPPVENYTLYYTATDRGGNNLALYRMQGSGADNEQLVDNVLEVTLDPTGQRIAYTRGVSSNNVLVYQLFVGPLDNPAAAQQVTSFASGNVTGPVFRPNGEEILFASNSDGDEELYIYNIAADSQTQITSNNTRDTSPSWAPSGRQVVFASDRASPPQADIYLLDFLDSGNILQANTEVLFDTTSNSSFPRFSPDGELITFVTDTRSGSEVLVGTSDGTRNRSITGADSRHLRPTWSPDGRYVYYISDAQTGILQIYYALPDGTQREMVPSPGLVVQSVAVRR